MASLLFLLLHQAKAAHHVVLQLALIFVVKKLAFSLFFRSKKQHHYQASTLKIVVAQADLALNWINSCRWHTLLLMVYFANFMPKNTPLKLDLRWNINKIQFEIVYQKGQNETLCKSYIMNSISAHLVVTITPCVSRPLKKKVMSSIFRHPKAAPVLEKFMDILGRLA